jgi:hypothetical protein
LSSYSQAEGRSRSYYLSAETSLPDLTGTVNHLADRAPEIVVREDVNRPFLPELADIKILVFQGALVDLTDVEAPPADPVSRLRLIPLDLADLAKSLSAAGRAPRHRAR